MSVSELAAKRLSAVRGVIELRAGSASAIIDPARGGRLTSLVVSGHEFIADAGQRPAAPDWYGGSFLLAPWAGRVPEGTHGLVLGKVWEVHSAGETAATVRLKVDHPVWAGVMEQRYTLMSERLEVRAVASPTRPTRTLLGMHPWFVREPDGASPVINATFESRVLPSGETAPISEVGEGAIPRDEVYRTATRVPTLTWRNGRRLMVEADVPVWVVYEQDPLGVCIEPWTGSPGDFVGGGGVRSAEHPAELSMGLRWN